MNAAAKVTQHLRKRIALGGFPTGARLPTERELAEALGVSRNTVREAIRSLSNDGIVETTRGRGGGTFVVDLHLSDLPDRADLANEFREFITQHMEYRMLIEPGAARLAAERGRESERRKLVDLLASEVPDLATYHRVDTEFHLFIAETSGNSVLSEAIADARTELFIGGNILWVQSDWHSIYGAEAPLSGIFRQEHAAIAAAVMAGDGEASARFMLEHLQESADQFQSLIAQLSS